MIRYTLNNVVRRYRESRTGQMVEAFRVPHLEIAPGEIVAVVGHNGSGKSTLLETLAFLQPPDVGQILLDGEDVWARGDPLSARRRCPMLLQRSVLFKTTVLRNVMYGLRARGIARTEARRRAENVLRVARLGHLAHRGHRELSGGERQRVALARLLVLEPDVLLLDEPTAHVDHDNEHLIEEMIRELHARGDMTVVLASHDSRQAMALADRVVTLVGGRMLSGPMDNLFTGTLHRGTLHRGMLHREEAGVTFCGEGQLVLHFTEEAMVRDESDHDVEENVLEGFPTKDTRVQIAIDTGRVRVDLPCDEQINVESCSIPRGRIESVRQYGDRCRLRILLAGGHRLHAELPLAEFHRLGLNLGTLVQANFSPGAIRVLPSS